MRSLGKQITLQLVVITILCGLLLGMTGILLITRNEGKKQLTQSVRIQAAGGACSGDESDFQGCSNGGNISNGCNWICNTAPAGVTLVIPQCCEILAQTGDPFACCFDARRRCTPQQCSAIPEGVSQQRCAQLWVLGYCSPPSPTPRPTSSKPSNTPIPTKAPTKVPTRQPTQKPTKIPTQPPPTAEPSNGEPTHPISPTTGVDPTVIALPTTAFQTGGQTFIIPTTVFQTNQSNVPFSQPEPITFALPQVAIPQIDVAGPAGQTIETVDRQLPRTLDFFEYLFMKVHEYDKRLEDQIRTRFDGLFMR